MSKLDYLVKSYLKTLIPILKKHLYPEHFNPKLFKSIPIDIIYDDQEVTQEVCLFYTNIRYLVHLLSKITASNDKYNTAKEILQFIIDNQLLKYNVIIDNQKIKPTKQDEIPLWYYHEPLIEIANKKHNLIDILELYMLTSKVKVYSL